MQKHIDKTKTRYREHHVRDIGADRSRNFCYSWAKYLLSSRFVPKNLKLIIHNCDFFCCFLWILNLVSLILSEEQGFGVFENMVLGKNFGLRGTRELGEQDEIGEGRKSRLLWRRGDGGEKCI